MLDPGQTQLGEQNSDQGGLDLGRYLEVLKRRALYIIIPFLLVLCVGTVVVMLLPPIYLSQARILVESQQIPPDLVRPTVVATAKERISVIEQRVLTREHLLGIIKKFDLYPKERQNLSESELLDLMRKQVHIDAVELNANKRSTERLTIAVNVGFENERPEVAMRVANEFLTLMLAEDARNRNSRASETAKFLAREVKRIETELGTLDRQISDLKRAGHAEPPVSEKMRMQLATMRAELQEKSTVFSNTHPDIVRLKRQIAAMEQLTSRAAPDETGLETLQNQRLTAEKSLDAANQKLTAARLGESLERDQFSERLEVLEQAILPQVPAKPNRLKFLGFVLAGAFAAGGGILVLAELLDKSIRSGHDLVGVADSRLVVPIPYIVTKAEARNRKKRIVMMATGTTAALVGGLAGVHLLYRPIDEIWVSFVGRLLS